MDAITPIQAPGPASAPSSGDPAAAGLPQNPLQANANPAIDNLQGNTNPTATRAGTTVTGRATWFGLNPPDSQGRITEDTQDAPNSGFFSNPATGKPWNSHDPNQQFASVPFSVFRASIGNPYDSTVQKAVSNGAYHVRVTANGVTRDLPLGDIGPSATTGNALDLSGGAALAMGLKDNTRASYQIISAADNKPVQFQANLGIDPNAPIDSGKTRGAYANDALQRYMRWTNQIAPGLKVLTPEDVARIDDSIQRNGFKLYNLPTEDAIGYHVAKDPSFLLRPENLALYNDLIYKNSPSLLQQAENIPAQIGTMVKTAVQDAWSYGQQVGDAFKGNVANLTATNAKGFGQGLTDAVDLVDASVTGGQSWGRNIVASLPFVPQNVKDALNMQNAAASQSLLLRNYQRSNWSNNIQNVAANAYDTLGQTSYGEAVRSATPPQSAVDAAATVANPMNYLPSIAGAGTVAAKGMFFERAIDATADAARLDAFSSNLSSSLAGSERVPKLGSEVASIAPQLRATTAAAATAMSDEGRIWQAVGDTAKDGGSVLGSIMQGAGNATQNISNVMKGLGSVPASIADHLAGGDASMKAVIETGAAWAMHHFIPGGGALYVAGKTASRFLDPVAKVMQLGGKELMFGEQSLPFFKALSRTMGEDPQFANMGITRGIVSTLDNPLVYSAISATKGAVSGAAAGAALGELSAGKPDISQAVSGAAMGSIYGMAGGGLGQWLKYQSPGQFMLEAAGDLRKAKSVMTTDELNGFNKLAPSDQGRLAQYLQHYPGLGLNFFNDPNGEAGYHEVIDGKSTVGINTASDTPLTGVISHELAHATVHSGNYGDIIDSILGNPDKGIPARYTPEEFANMKQQYVSKLRGKPTSGLSDADIALELYAEQGAHYLTSGQGLLDAKSAFNPLVSANPGALKTAMGKLGYTFDFDGNNVKGNNIFERQGASKDVYNLQKAYFLEKQKWNLARDDVMPDAIYRPEDLKGSPGLLDRFKAVPEIARDTKGNVLRDNQGNLVFRTAAQVNKEAALMGDTIRQKIAFLSGDVRASMGHWEDDNGTTHFDYLPDSIIKDLKDSGKFNGEQLKNLEMINDARKDPSRYGQEFQMTYQSALKNGKYTSIGAQNRYFTPHGFQISKGGNVLIQAADFPKLTSKYLKLQGRPEMRAAKFLNVSDFVDTANKVLDNHSKNLPGATGLDDNPILAAAKKDAVIGSLGLNTNAWRNNNIFAKHLPNNTGSFILTPRLDRVNMLSPTGVLRPWKNAGQYNMLTRNYLPGNMNDAKK